MHRADAENVLEGEPADKAAGPAALPWQWFEFRERARVLEGTAGREALRGSEGAGAEENASQVWQVDVDGQAVWFKYIRQPATDAGKPRPAVMLLPGMGLVIASFRGISGWLFETHDLILPDYAGLCLDGPAVAPASIRAFGATIWRIADALGIQRLSLGGNSLGGGLALMATLERPDRVERLALANPACFPQALPKMYRLARIPILGELLMTITRPEKLIGGAEYIGYVDKTRFDPVLRGLYMATMAQRRNRFRLMRMIRDLPANERDVTSWPLLPRLGEIRQEVLVTWGVQDKLLVPDSGPRLAAALPHAIYEPQGDLAHMPHEEAPERVGRRWAEFLNQGR